VLFRSVDYLSTKDDFGSLVKFGEPLLQKTISSSDSTHYHFIVSAQFENKVALYWVHLEHSNYESKIRSFSIK